MFPLLYIEYIYVPASFWVKSVYVRAYRLHQKNHVCSSDYAAGTCNTYMYIYINTYYIHSRYSIYTGVFILRTQTMDHIKGNPSKLPYMCIVWFPPKRSHLMTPAIFYLGRCGVVTICCPEAQHAQESWNMIWSLWGMETPGPGTWRIPGPSQTSHASGRFKNLQDPGISKTWVIICIYKCLNKKKLFVHTGHSKKKTSRTSTCPDILFVELTGIFPRKLREKRWNLRQTSHHQFEFPWAHGHHHRWLTHLLTSSNRKFPMEEAVTTRVLECYFLCVPGAFVGEKHGKTLQVISNLCVVVCSWYNQTSKSEIQNHQQAMKIIKWI